MKLLVFGRTGQVARELQRIAPPGWDTRFLGREDADLAAPTRCAEAIADHKPDAVINAAAYTAVDRAESEPELADTVNAEAPGAMARAAAETGAPFFHISTDYVFDGEGEAPFAPDKPPAPLGVYGRTKLSGERQIAEAGGNWLVLRTSWIFSAHGSNFVRTMLRLGAERDALGVVDDQIGGPTPAAAVAEALLACAKAMAGGQRGGLYHFAGYPYVSWAGFAEAIMRESGLDCRIDRIPTSHYPTPALRPGNSRLDCASFERDFPVRCPDWRSHLKTVITELAR